VSAGAAAPHAARAGRALREWCGDPQCGGHDLSRHNQRERGTNGRLWHMRMRPLC